MLIVPRSAENVIRVRIVDLDRLRGYLRAMAGVAAYGAEAQARELLAAAHILRVDAPRALAAMRRGV